MLDIELDISFGKCRADTNWKTEYLTWDEFVAKLQKVRRTKETMAEYDKMNNVSRGKVKDGPAFVGGLVRGGRRKKANVDTRSLITLDADHVGKDDDFMFSTELILGGCAYVIYSTHSHRGDKQKYRLIIPTNRHMNPDEYAAVSRKVAEQIGLNFFDKTTFDIHRLMYLPSCSKDAEPIIEVADGDALDVDDILSQYDDWHDPMQWPRHINGGIARKASSKMEDPRDKHGVVGAFCRTYTITKAIEKFLNDKYTPVDDSLTRYTYVGSSSQGGFVVYDDDTFAYSHHESDPISGREVNAFDLVLMNKFAKLDDNVSEKTNITKRPSYIAMLNLATNDPKVKRELLSGAREDFSPVVTDKDDEEADDAWIEELELHPKNGSILATAKNAELILSHALGKKVLAFDAFGNTEVIKKELPWRKKKRPHRPYEPWLGADDKRLQHWFSKAYGINAARIIQNAFAEVVHANTFHPIKEYIEAQSWDGTERAESIFIKYLGAEDSHYVKQVTRKILLAAVKRLYAPGCKFDEMLVLVGPQGCCKSSIIAKLGKEWFSDSLRTFENKEAGEHLQSGWIFEIGELSAMKKTEIEEVKAFLSKTEDRYRVAYDRQVSDFPRKCVFFGTTNTREFLRDRTGNRRFWPVDVIGSDDLKAQFWREFTDDVVAQIWAEVLTWFKAGESLVLDDKAREEAERQQAEHTEEDPRLGIIQEWLDALIEDGDFTESEETDIKKYRNRVCASQIWVECLGNKKGSMRRWEAEEIRALMREVPGWKEQDRKKQMTGYGAQRVFDRIIRR